MQGDTGDQKKNPRPPHLQRQREQGFPLPPKQAEDQKRNQRTMAVIRGRAGGLIGIFQPSEQRRRMDVAQSGIAEELKQHQPRRQQAEEK